MLQALASPIRGAGARYTGGGRGAGIPATLDAPLLKVLSKNLPRPSFCLVVLSTVFPNLHDSRKEMQSILLDDVFQLDNAFSRFLRVSGLHIDSHKGTSHQLV